MFERDQRQSRSLLLSPMRTCDIVYLHLTPPASPVFNRLCSSPLEFAWLVMPRVVSLVPRMLERAGLLADVTLLPTPLSWIPLDEDLISLELPDVFRVSFGRGPTFLPTGCHWLRLTLICRGALPLRTVHAASPEALPSTSPNPFPSPRSGPQTATPAPCTSWPLPFPPYSSDSAPSPASRPRARLRWRWRGCWGACGGSRAPRDPP